MWYFIIIENIKFTFTNINNYPVIVATTSMVYEFISEGSKDRILKPLLIVKLIYIIFTIWVLVIKMNIEERSMTL